MPSVIAVSLMLAPVDSPPVVVALLVPVLPLLLPSVAVLEVAAEPSVVVAVAVPAVSVAPVLAPVGSPSDSVSAGEGVPHARPSPATKQRSATDGDVVRRARGADRHMEGRLGSTIGQGSSPPPTLSTAL